MTVLLNYVLCKPKSPKRERDLKEDFDKNRSKQEKSEKWSSKWSSIFGAEDMKKPVLIFEPEQST
jgi:hypothetical protein